MAGVTPTGFLAETLPSLSAQLQADLKATFGASINTSPQSRFGQLIGILAERLLDLWDLAQHVYSAFDANAASGAALDNLASLTGTTRKAATYSTATLTATGVPATVLPVGRVVSATGTGDRFDTQAAATIAAVAAWAASTVFVEGDRRTNGGNVYQVTATGASAGSGGPTGTGFAVVDGTVTWRYLGQGTGAVDVAVRAETTGPRTVNAGTLVTIQSPVSGWYGATNLVDGTLGADIETDAALRARRLLELQAGGNSAVEAIRGKLLQLSGVTAATVFENPGDVADANGMPPHSFEALVQGGADADIAAAIWSARPAGIATTGATTSSVTDSQGTARTVRWSRAEALNISVAVTLTKDPLTYPADGGAQVRDAILAYGASQRTGKDVVAGALLAQVFSVPGVLDATVLMSSAAAPATPPAPSSSATVPVSTRQVAVYDSARVAVNDSASGVP